MSIHNNKELIESNGTFQGTDCYKTKSLIQQNWFRVGLFQDKDV